MAEFGTVSGLVHEIRVDRLEDRLEPKVGFPHRHDFFHLVVVSEGAGWHEIDFQRHRVSKGRIFFMKPGQVHAWKLAPSTKGVVIEFNEGAFSGSAQDSLTAKLLRELPDAFDLRGVEKSVRDGIDDLLSFLLSQQAGKFPALEEMRRSLLLSLLIAFYQTGAITPSPALDPFREKFLAAVEASYSREHEVSFYAKHLGVTPKALTMRITRSLGRSARTVILDRCFLEGKRLLAYSDLGVAAVGERLGFQDPNYFSRFSKGQSGRSPGDFRKQARSLSSGK